MACSATIARAMFKPITDSVAVQKCDRLNDMAIITTNAVTATTTIGAKDDSKDVHRVCMVILPLAVCLAVASVLYLD